MTQEVQRYKGKDKMEVLKSVWGFDSFREGQEEIIDKVLAGEDVLVLAKTSFGKSLSYQLPALILDGTAIIVSPLLSLQEDQVNSLKAKGVSAELLNSTQPAAEKKRVKDAIKKGKVDMVFAAPETLVQPTNLKWFKKNADVSFLALDEAHCFPGDTQVVTEEGPLSFYQLALRQEEGTLPKALSKNLETGSTEYKQITKVFKNPSQPLLKIKLNDRSNFLVTPTHSIFTDKGEVLARDLTLEHRLISFEQKAFRRPLTRAQESFVVGSILGDGGCGVSVLEDKMRLKFVHSEPQKEYLKWKHSFLGTSTGIRSYTNEGYSGSTMYAFTSRMFPVEEPVYSLPHGTLRENFPEWVFKAFDLRSLAIWIMDDGSYSSKVYTIHCNSFSESLTRRFMEVLRNILGVSPEFFKSKGYSGIRFRTEDSETIRRAIAPYVHPSMAYKLGLEDNPEFIDWVDRAIPTHKVTIQSIERVSDSYDNLYDMEVEGNHNYFIHCRRGSVCKPQEPILVHNCISQYGSDFRPKYFQVGEIKDELNCPVLAVTATADKVTLDDVKSVLGFGKGKRPFSKIEHYLDRPSIHYHILRKSFAPVQQVLSLIRERDSKETGIIYCTTRKEVDSLQYELYKKRVKVVKYHAGMTKEDRQKSLEAWLAGDAQVAVCTIAFGMGIDKPDVRYVIHYNIPSTIEGYIQETGRASRDGLPSDVYMLYDYRDVGKIQWILKQSTENKVTLSKKLKKLDQMVQIAESDDCIRAQLLGYFGQDYPKKNCGGCSNCVSHTEL